MYKRIMVAVDESFMTSKVMEAAVQLARSNGAQLAICHAIDETILAQREVAMMLPNSVGKTEARMRLGAQGFLGRLAETARAAGVEAEIRLVESGQPFGHLAAAGARRAVRRVSSVIRGSFFDRVGQPVRGRARDASPGVEAHGRRLVPAHSSSAASASGVSNRPWQ
jgi:nucleotide-binding universal stress UspA family protein